MALSRDVVIRLLGDADSAVKAQKAAADAAEVTVQQYRKAEREHDRVTKSMEAASRKQRAAMEDVGRGSMIAGAAIVAGLGLAVKAAMNWESAWTGVVKTVNGTDKQLAQVEKGLRDLTKILPASHEEIAGVAEAAGQLGVETGSIVKFTKTMIDLGETTNLSADQAATSLAQLMNVMQTAPKDVSRLGASLVALGNAGASSEADIVNMASYITGSARLIGASESDVLALANAMTSMGINAERGGGVMTRVMQDVYAAVQTGGDELDKFAKVAGVSSAEFARSFRADPIRAIDSFIQGLNRVETSGGNVISTLDDLGYKGTQDTAVLLQLKGAGDLLTDSLDLGSKAWKENTALIQEAAKRYDTTAAKTEMARNAINDAAIEIGDVFLPVMASLAESVADVATWFAELPAPIQGVLSGLAGVAGVGALVGGAFLLLGPRVMETYKAFQLLRNTSPGVASGLGAIGKAAGVLGVLFTVKAGVDGLVESLKEAPPTMAQTTDALLGMGDGMERVDAMFKMNKADVFGDDIKGLADAARELTDPGLIDRLDDFGGEIASFGGSEGRVQRDAIVDQLGQMGDSLAMMVQSGNAELAAEQFTKLSAEWTRGGGSVEDLKNLMPAYEEALASIDNEQKEAAASARLQGEQAALLAQDTDIAYSSLTTYAAALGLSEDATQDLIDKSNALGESLGGFIDPLGTYTSLLQTKAQAEADAANAADTSTDAQAKSWEDYVDSVDVSFDEYLAMLEQQVADQQNWQTNMLMLAGQVSDGTLAELARMGPEGAPLVADLVNASDAELARFDDVTRARSKEATDAWGQQLTLATPVLRQVAALAGQGVVDELAAKLRAGTTTVAAIAQQYGINLAGGINPILTALGKRPIAGVGGRLGGLTEADGGVVRYYAEGGAESHVAQIAPAGAWRVWAEPETGGEAYIPLSPAKRARSVGIWQETGRLLGQYADGGFTSTASVPRPPSTAPYQSPISTGADATMDSAYKEAVAWLAANLVTGGTAGSGSAAGSWQAIFNFVKARIPQARANSTYRPGDPGYHGKGKAVDFGFGSGPGGNGSAGLASINRLLHDAIGGNLAELIYDGIGDDRPDLWHGKAHTYNAGTRAEHHNHVHAANYAKGGIFNPHIRDAGGPLLPGFTFNGTGRSERVLPALPVGSGGKGSGVSAPVTVVMSDAQVFGTLVVDQSGLAQIVDGRIEASFSQVIDRVRFNR